MTSEVKTPPKLLPAGDTGVMLRFGDVITPETHNRVQEMAEAITNARLKGVRELVPSFTGLLVVYDPLATDYGLLHQAISALTPCPLSEKTQREWRVPTCYEGDFAPDLEAVADACGISPEAAINAHTSGRFQLGMYGFAPGYGYLSGTPKSIQVPRKSKPVRDIPLGAVMIAGPQCIITTMVMPTGWSIIGRTAFQMFRPDDAETFPVSVGDWLRFERISRDAYHRETQA